MRGFKGLGPLLTELGERKWTSSAGGGGWYMCVCVTDKLEEILGHGETET